MSGPERAVVSENTASLDNHALLLAPGCLTLFIAGGTPSSASAVESLSKILADMGLQQSTVHTVDVFVQPERALHVGLIATPALLAEVNERRRWFIGDLRQPERTRAWLISVFAT